MATLEFLIIVPSALLAAYFGWRLCNGMVASQPKTTAQISCALWLAVLFGLGGLISTYRISTATRPSVRGVIANLRQSGGRSPQSYFNLLTTDGQTVALQASHHGPEIQDGETVNVTYLSDYNAVLDLKVLSGKYSGWSMNGGDGLQSSHISAAAGLTFAAIALALYLQRREV
jgi:hypothetical protein